jgi:hypothetical protein
MSGVEYWILGNVDNTGFWENDKPFYPGWVTSNKSTAITPEPYHIISSINPKIESQGKRQKDKQAMSKVKWVNNDYWRLSGPYDEDNQGWGWASSSNQPITPEPYPSDIRSSVNDQIESQNKRQQDKKKQTDRQQDIWAIQRQGIPKSIAKTVLPPTSKQIKKTMAEIPPTGVHIQVECSDNMPCGTNCWKDGKLWKIVCSERERQELYPAVVPEKHGASPKETREILKQYPSLTPNFL